MADEELPDAELPQASWEDMDPLERVERAIQEFIHSVNEREGDPPQLLDTAIVVWEAMRFDEDGDVRREVNYTVPTPRASLSSTMGLLELGSSVVHEDLFD